jgi:hypothetical protein
MTRPAAGANDLATSANDPNPARYEPSEVRPVPSPQLPHAQTGTGGAYRPPARIITASGTLTAPPARREIPLLYPAGSVMVPWPTIVARPPTTTSVTRPPSLQAVPSSALGRPMATPWSIRR